MLKYIGKRILMMIPVLLGVIIFVFTIMYLTPGNPARIMLGPNASEEAVQQLLEEKGFDRPYLVQLTDYIKNIVLRGDFGESFQTGEPVLKEILERFPTTLKLATLSVTVSLVFGLTFGIISATKQYSILDKVTTSFALLGVSMPSFWAGLMATILFSSILGWLPASGSYGWKYWILPPLVLGLHSAASIMRMTRSSMLEVIRQDYIRTARAKGQTESKVIIIHALRNALIPVVTVVGMQFGILLGGSILIESVFALPGLGRLIIGSIGKRDRMVVQGGVLFLALAFSLVNLLVDILYAFIDPRIKSQYQASRKRRKEVPNHVENKLETQENS